MRDLLRFLRARLRPRPAVAHPRLVKSLASAPCRDQLFLARIGAVAVDAPLVSVQQIGQRVLVVHVGGRDHRAVHQAALAVHADVQLHAEVPLPTLLGLVHLGVAGVVGVLGRARRSDDGGVDDGAGLELNRFAARPPDLGEQLLAELVVIEQAAELEHRGGVGHGLAAQVDPHEAAQGGTVVQSLLAGPSARLNQCWMKWMRSALKADRRTPAHALG